MHKDIMITKHDSFAFTEAVDSTHPFLGGTPDVMTTRTCCSSRTVEVKCPFCHKDDDLTGEVDGQFCLAKSEQDIWQLNVYYYQIQRCKWKCVWYPTTL